MNGLLQHWMGPGLDWFFRETVLWTVFGLVGNALFSSRFIVQWLYSERLKRVVVPPIFWHLSFWGSVVTLIYAFHVDKLPVILGCIFLPFLYARNLVLLYRKAPEQQTSPSGPSQGPGGCPS